MDGNASFPQDGDTGRDEVVVSSSEQVDTQVGHGAVGIDQGRRDHDGDFTSVTFDSSDDSPPTRDQGSQTLTPHLVNNMTQYSDPDHFGSDTSTNETESSSRRPVLFSAQAAPRRTRRRLLVSDWLLPNPPITEDSVQYTGNGHLSAQTDEPGSADARPPQ